MKATSNQILNTVTRIAVAMINKYVGHLEDDVIAFRAARITEMIITYIPDDDPKSKALNKEIKAENPLVNYPWSDKGASYIEMESWLKENSGFTSNRKAQKFIHEALDKNIIRKDESTKRYFRIS